MCRSSALKDEIDSSASGPDINREQIVLDAINSLSLSREEQGQLVPRASFLAAFKRFSTNKRLSETAKGKTKPIAKKRKTGR